MVRRALVFRAVGQILVEEHRDSVATHHLSQIIYDETQWTPVNEGGRWRGRRVREELEESNRLGRDRRVGEESERGIGRESEKSGRGERRRVREELEESGRE